MFDGFKAGGRHPKRPLIGAGTAIIIVIMGGFLWFGFLTIQLMKMSHESNMISETCYMYLKNGVPQTIEIEDTTYHLDSDGSITAEDRIFLNPYHQMELARTECIKVNIPEENYIQQE